jgi:Spy/CpxP family protein refolding chaperone
MNTRNSFRHAALAALAILSMPAAVQAQSTYDDTQQLIAQIQSDKRAVVLQAMQLTEEQVAKFIPIYDAYQIERKALMERGVQLLNSYAANYDSMTDEAAGKLLKEWFALQDDENALMRKYAKKLDKVLPTTRVLRFVQIENKLNSVMRLPAIRNVPLAPVK